MFAQHDSSKKVVTPHVSPSLRFTENNGQWDDKILLRAQLDGGAMFLEKNGLSFNFYDKKKYRSLHHGGILKGAYKDLDINGHAYKIYFEAANTNVSIEKNEAGSDYENFFIGSDETKWRGGVKNYKRCFLRNLYDGVDYEIIAASGAIKYNFHLKPGADVKQIALRYEGVEKISLKDGALTLSLNVNEIKEHKPYAYQLINGQVKKVLCVYRLKNNVLSFDFPEGYNKNYALVIDPLLVFAAQSGSLADNFGMTATYDPAGNLYSGGTVFNVGYPTTTGAYSSSFGSPIGNGNTDVVITKYNSNGTSLLYSTYFGGNGTEIITSLIVDQNNNLCFYGATGSSNFPTTSGAFDNTFNGGQFLSFLFNGTTFNNGTDIYIGKFNSGGTSLLACTYLGGSGNDGVNHVNAQTFLPPPFQNILEYRVDSLQFNYGDQYRGEIQLDPSNNIYIASSTRSSNFPTANAFDNTLGGRQDGIIAKFNPNLSTLLYSSYVGGSKNDAGYGLVVKNNFEVYITGGTCSNDFPYMAGGYKSTYQGGKADGYILRISPTGTVVLNGTYFGTSSYDQSYLIQTDKYDDIYIYGQSYGNIPVVTATNAVTVYSVAGTHQFVSRLNKTLTNLNMSTVFGHFTSRSDISPSAFSIDRCNNIYLSGWGGDVIDLSTFPLSNMPLFNPTQSSTDGRDFYFMALDSNATQLLYGSYLGGNQSAEHVDGGTSRFDPSGKIYQSVCAGCGGNDDFPVTPGAWPNTPGNPNFASNCNNGVIKLDFQILITISTISTASLAGCAPFTPLLTNATASANTTYTWYNGSTPISNNATVTANFLTPGIYTLSLVSLNNSSCNRKDSAISYITVYPSPTVNFSFSMSPCNNTIFTNNTSLGSFGSNPFLWNFGNSATSTLTAPSYTYLSNGDYNLSLTVRGPNGCSSTLSKPLSIFNFTTSVNPPVTICNKSGVELKAAGGTNYTWTPSGSLNNNLSATPFASPNITTVYTVAIVYSTPQRTCAGTGTTQVLVNPKPVAAFSFSTNPCGGGAYFTDLSTDNIVTWKWQFNATASSTVQNPYYFYFVGGNFDVRLIVTNEYGCKDTISKPLVVASPPNLSITSPTLVCKGNSAQLGATGGTAYAWSPAASLDLPLVDNPTATPLVSTDYSVAVTTTNYVNGAPCIFLLVTSVGVSEFTSQVSSAQANPKYVITGDSSKLTYLGEPGLLVTWYPLGTTRPANGYTVMVGPDRPTTYTAVATKGACRRDAEVFVEAYTEGCIDKDAFVPNTFTPNNDGQNDVFFVRGLKIDEVYFAVYNRWGELVFETTDKTKGWDGLYKNRPADVGVFGWYLKVKCFNGEETFRKGNVTLIR